MIAPAGRRMDAPLIRHAWARGQETIDRAEGEDIKMFVARTCATFGANAVVRLANAAGGTVAYTVGGETIRPARLLPSWDRQEIGCTAEHL